MMLLVTPTVPDRMATALPPGAGPAMVACTIVELIGDRKRYSAPPAAPALLRAMRTFTNRTRPNCARPPPLPCALLLRHRSPVTAGPMLENPPPPVRAAPAPWLSGNRPHTRARVLFVRTPPPRQLACTQRLFSTCPPFTTMAPPA